MTDPRIRQRRVEVARAAGRRRLHMLLGILAAVTLAVLALAVLHSSLFSVRRVTVVGAPAVDRSAVLAAAGLGTHPPLLDVDAAAVAARVEALPQVASAVVHVQWPSGVEIVLTQRRPAAVAAVGPSAGWAVLDATGHVLQRVATRPPALPLVALPVPPGAPGSVLPPAAAPLLATATALPPSLAPEVESVGYASAGSIVLRMQSPLTVVIGSDSALRQKLDSLSILLANLATRGIATVDLSVPSAPVLTPIGARPTVHRIGGG